MKKIPYIIACAAVFATPNALIASSIFTNDAYQYIRLQLLIAIILSECLGALMCALFVSWYLCYVEEIK